MKFHIGAVKNDDALNHLQKERLYSAINELIRDYNDIKVIAEKAAKLVGDYMQADRTIIAIPLKSRDIKFEILAENLAGDFPRIKDGRVAFCYEDLWHKLASENKAINIYDVYNISILRDVKTQLEEASVKSMLIIRAGLRKHFDGMLCVQSCNNKKKWHDSQVEAFEKAAEQIAIAMQRVRIVSDLIEAKASLEEKNVELSEALKKQEKLLEMQSDFVAMASHEFRTPIAIIDSSAELIMLSKYKKDDAYLEKQVEKIRRAAKRMASLVDTTLSLHKIEKGRIEHNPEEINLAEFIDDIARKMNEERIKIHCRGG